MRLAWWTAALTTLLMACTNEPTPTPDDTDPPVDDTDESDSPTDDTDVLETGWGDTDGTVDTSGDTGGGGPPPPDSGDPPPVNDTAPCAFGEVLDCDGECYPTYFIGDGSCDDGSAFQSNFDCVTYQFDGGDCQGDTDAPPVIVNGCDWLVRIDAVGDAFEIGWQIQTRGNQVLYEVAANTYQVNNRSYSHMVRLESGTYTFVQTDSGNDGWQNGKFFVIDPSDQSIISTGGITRGNYGEQDFTITCEIDTDTQPPTPGSCGDVEIVVETQNYGTEVGWELLDEQRNRINGVRTGVYRNYETYSYELSLADGVYIFGMHDGFGDGWNDSTFTITDRGTGQQLATGTLVDGYYGEQYFAVDCSDTGPDPVIPIVTTCDPAVVKLTTASSGAEIGWELRNGTSGRLAGQGAIGEYANSRTYLIDVEVETGPYTFRLIDRDGDGWEGNFIELVDATGYNFGGGGDQFLRGFSYSFDVDVVCPDVEPPVDTAVCAPDTIVDCNGVCWPVAYVGDGFCDDGTTYAAHFYCADLQWDRGDCGPPPP